MQIWFIWAPFLRLFSDFTDIGKSSHSSRFASLLRFCAQGRVNLRILTRRPFFGKVKFAVFEFWFYRKFMHLCLFLRLYCLNFLCVTRRPFLPSWILSLMRVRLSQTSPTRSFVPVQIYAVSHRAIDLNRRKFVFKRRYAKTSLRIFCKKLTDLPQTAV